MQSAIGRIQLERISEWHKIRSRNAMILREKLYDLKAFVKSIKNDKIL